MSENDTEVGGENMAVIRPSWADPRYVLATNETRFTSPAFGMNVITKIAQANPNRWMIGFQFAQGGFATVLVAPHPRPDLYGLSIATANPQTFYTLFNYGPFVSGEWYAFATSAGTIGLYEVMVN